MQQRQALFLQRLFPEAERFRLRKHCVGACKRVAARFDIICAPERLLSCDAFRQRICVQAVCHPCCRIDFAAHHVIAALSQIQQPPVVAPIAERIDHGGKIRLIVKLCVEFRKHVPERLGAQCRCLLLICYAEIGGKICLRCILPQNGLTEAVNRGDLRKIDACQLPLQMAVVRCDGKRVCDARSDLTAQFRRGCSCVCNNQKIIEVGGICRIGQIAHQPVNQNFCFPGTCRRRNEQRAASILCRSPLLRRCTNLSHAPASFQVPARIPPA